MKSDRAVAWPRAEDLIEPAHGAGLAVYCLVRSVSRLVLGNLCHLSVIGAENLPDGGFVLAPVHRSDLDAFVVCAFDDRIFRYLGKDNLWRWPRLGRLFELMGAFPVHRDGADREALTWAVQVARAGQAVAIFPEGTRREGPVVADLHSGCVAIAGRAQVPIVPLGISGTEQILPRGARWPRLVPITVVVGPALPPPALSESGRIPMRTLKAETERLTVALQAAFDEARGAEPRRLDGATPL
jgi:1-acyl-sn-glycerol-3-phosphate acyltransferase